MLQIFDSNRRVLLSITLNVSGKLVVSLRTGVSTDNLLLETERPLEPYKLTEIQIRGVV